MKTMLPALAVAALLALPAAALHHCAHGPAAGQLDLPEAGMDGSIKGGLAVSPTGPIVFGLKGKLVDKTPSGATNVRGGVAGGLIPPGATAPSHAVRGRYVADPATGRGRLFAVVLSNTPMPKRVGRIAAKFEDAPAPAPSVGKFGGHWIVCK